MDTDVMGTDDVVLGQQESALLFSSPALQQFGSSVSVQQSSFFTGFEVIVN
ncbi:hypothetical protein [Paenibacillus sp. ACRRY]|uniref:hypothetical protein n=1 Tax=Paenibacillus sp. ACRRY TaxID=2918208 RepID=UPI001EF5BEB8